MARIACLQVPLFPLAARLRSEPELRGELGAANRAHVRAHYDQNLMFDAYAALFDEVLAANGHG